jgi:hypothetical protein
LTAQFVLHHGGDRNIFEVMTSTLPTRTLGSVASLLAATLYQGNLRTKLYDKRDDFNFPIVNFPFIYSNIPRRVNLVTNPVISRE